MAFNDAIFAVCRLKIGLLNSDPFKYTLLVLNGNSIHSMTWLVLRKKTGLY